MLAIIPCLDKSKLAACCKKCGKLYSAAFYLYLAENRGQTLAAGLFEVEGDGVSAVYYEAEDPGDRFIFDGVLRAGLNYAAEQGISLGRLPESFRESHKELFAGLNYPPEPEFNIEGFFGKYKNC